MKRTASRHAKAGVLTPSANNMTAEKHTSFFTPAIHQGGEPLDQATRSFMEDRFHYDFSNVRIHKDAAAHQSAQGVNALAYTTNADIVFGAGQYQPHTRQGKKLLAHELTHVVQQGQSGNSMVQRQLAYSDPVPVEKDPVPIVYNQEKGGQPRDKTSVGLTTPTFNGKKMSEMSEFDLSGLFVMKAPSEEKNGRVTCKIDTSGVNAQVSAEELIITASDRAHQWKGRFADHPDATCDKKANIPVVLTDTTAGKNLYDIILNNENEHVADLKKLVQDTNTFLSSIDGFSSTGANQRECTAKLIAKIGKTANPALGLAREFASKWKTSLAAWDNPGKHTIKKSKANISKDCSKIQYNLGK